MKTSFHVALAVALVTAALPAVARAQMVEEMKFTTTFAFTAGKTHFSPGTYVARPLDGEPTVVEIQGEHGGPTALLVAIGDMPKHDPQMSGVTFVREGQTLVLKRIWDESSGEGVDVSAHPVTATVAN